MVSITKKFVAVVIMLAIVILIGSYYSLSMLSERLVISNINSQLYEVSIEISLLEYIDENYPNDNKLKDDVKYIILKKMTNISMVRPNLNDLEGVPVSALKKVLDYNNDKSLAFSYPDDSFSYVFDYLVAIERDINVLMQKKQDILSKPFKENPWGKHE